MSPNSFHNTFVGGTKTLKWILETYILRGHKLRLTELAQNTILW